MKKIIELVEKSLTATLKMKDVTYIETIGIDDNTRTIYSPIPVVFISCMCRVKGTQDTIELPINTGVTRERLKDTKISIDEIAAALEGIRQRYNEEHDCIEDPIYVLSVINEENNARNSAFCEIIKNLINNTILRTNMGFSFLIDEGNMASTTNFSWVLSDKIELDSSTDESLRMLLPNLKITQNRQSFADLKSRLMKSYLETFDESCKISGNAFYSSAASARIGRFLDFAQDVEYYLAEFNKECYTEKVRGFEPISSFKELVETGDLILPSRADDGSAGYDIFALEDIIINPGETVKVETGLKAYMPNREYLDIYLRSSIARKNPITIKNIVPIIDSSYYNSEETEGHIMILLRNYSDIETITINKGEHFVQGIFKSFHVTDDDKPRKTDRTGGFGSTNN